MALNYRYAGTPRGRLLYRYTSARMTLIMMILLTVVNIVMYIAQADTYFLFSASIPYMLPIIFDQLALKDPSYAALVIPAAIMGVVMMVPYVLAFFFSKKPSRYGWLVASLILFAIDTIGFFALCDITSGILDLIFHLLVIGELGYGIYCGIKANKMPEDEPAQVFAGATNPSATASTDDSAAYTSADDARNQNEK